jgi:Tfp pilus assembly protein PilF
LEEASAALDGVMERFPDYVPSYLMAGQIEESLGHPERAAERYRSGVEVAREEGNAHAVGELGVALDALSA